MGDKLVLDQLRRQVAEIEHAGSLQEQVKPRVSKLADNRSSGKDLESAEYAFSRIVALVNASDKPECTIRQRLGQIGFSEQAIDEAVSRAKSYGFIDDVRYADVLIRSRLSQGRGLPGIEHELRSCNIDISNVPGWPDEYATGPDEEFERALAVLDSRPPRSKNLREGAYRKLVGKGYSSSVASSAARAWVDAQIR